MTDSNNVIPFRPFWCVVCSDTGCEFCPPAPVDRRSGIDRRGMHTLVGESLDELELEARKAEGFARLERTLEAPLWDEAGSVEVRVTAALAALLLAGVLVYVVWPYIVGAAVTVAAWRFVTRHGRRRRPRSSWSSLGRTAALMYAAWNSRWLRVDRKASVPARAVTAPTDHDPPTASAAASSFDGPVPF